jgi:hypothetical protein
MMIEDDILIPEDVYDEICIILDCDYISFMGIS